MAEQVVILAGGLGTRLRPITETIPKPLVEINDQPFLYWQIQEAKRLGYRRILLLVAYLGHMIEEHFKDGSELGVEIEYAYEKEPLGTGGALRNALSMLDDEFFLLNGDSFLSLDMKGLQKLYDQGSSDAVIASFPYPEKTDVPGNLKVDANFVVSYKKAAGVENGYSQVDAGVYIMHKKVVESYERERFQLEQLWPPLIEAKRLQVFPVEERFYDIGTPERLKEFEEFVRDYFAHTISH
jgi:MurNAc alpha-1-phosphate uridylyltransferase